MERKLNVWQSPLFKHVLIGLAACAAYIFAAKLSLRLASVHPSASPFWPPTGLAILTLLLLGQRTRARMHRGKAEAQLRGEDVGDTGGQADKQVFQ